MKRFSFSWVWVLLAVACTPAREVDYEDPSIYFSSSNSVTLVVYYEPGAEPFTGTTAGGGDIWNITKDNLAAIFTGRQTTVSYPNALPSMTALSAQSKTIWSSDDILALSNSVRTNSSTATASYFHLLFLNGNYSTDGTANTGVIGVTLGGTATIAIFKDVVKSSAANPNGPVARFVEQATIVHEMGHALGLVNNGVTTTSNHQDTSHGAHCTNTNCVMYWQNEGKSDLAAFIQQFITSGNTVMLGTECLNDVTSYRP